jgi:hypothetical protein
VRKVVFLGHRNFGNIDENMLDEIFFLQNKVIEALIGSC